MPVAESEQKRIQSRVKVAKHQQHIENFTRVWVPVLLTVENTDNAEIGEGLPAKEESCHKHEGCLGCFKVACIGLGVIFGRIGTFNPIETNIIMLASNTVHHDIEHAGSYQWQNKVQKIAQDVVQHTVGN